MTPICISNKYLTKLIVRHNFYNLFNPVPVKFVKNIIQQ